MATLSFFRGSEPILEFKLRAGRTTIGRSDGCDVSLPGNEISRTHCFVEGKGDGWELVDRSRHGTWVDGKPAERARLHDGSKVVLGPFTMEFREGRAEPLPTIEAVADRNHEFLIASDKNTLCVERAQVRIVAGPDEGRVWTLRQGRATLGVSPSDLVVTDPSTLPHHVQFRVSLGRVMVEPGAGATYLDGVRIRDVTPVRIGEELRLGQTLVRVETDEAVDDEAAPRFGDMVGQSRVMREMFGLLRRVAGHHAPVLLVGESGTGKELAARGIHDASMRSAGRHIALNCGAISTELFESELFGHEKGAFTGALARKDGAFHAAHGGTLFLDEVGELPIDAQAKLLRTLETGEVRRVGSVDVEFPDVRVVAATNRDLVADVRSGQFREDLFFRLAVLTVRLPPLRERALDVESLAVVLAKALHPEATISPEAMDRLREHDWPGNVRELRNVLQRAIVIGGAFIEPRHLSFHDLGRATKMPSVDGGLEDAERAYITQAIRRNDSNLSATARDLGIARSTLQYKMRRLGFDG